MTKSTVNTTERVQPPKLRHKIDKSWQKSQTCRPERGMLIFGMVETCHHQGVFKTRHHGMVKTCHHGMVKTWHHGVVETRHSSQSSKALEALHVEMSLKDWI